MRTTRNGLLQMCAPWRRAHLENTATRTILCISWLDRSILDSALPTCLLLESIPHLFFFLSRSPTFYSFMALRHSTLRGPSTTRGGLLDAPPSGFWRRRRLELLNLNAGVRNEVLEGLKHILEGPGRQRVEGASRAGTVKGG